MSHRNTTIAARGWELDVWGRLRRLNEAARAHYLASDEARRGVLTTLVADVAQNYLALRGFIYLVLAAQFESFRDPFIILAGSVPLAISGALLFSFLGLTTLNIYVVVGRRRENVDVEATQPAAAGTGPAPALS